MCDILLHLAHIGNHSPLLKLGKYFQQTGAVLGRRQSPNAKHCIHLGFLQQLAIHLKFKRKCKICNCLQTRPFPSSMTGVYGAEISPSNTPMLSGPGDPTIWGAQNLTFGKL